jgi:hypothetical protein
VQQHKATELQVNYIDCLFIDLGFDPERKRHAMVSLTGKKYADELSVSEASNLISQLKEWKENKFDFH